jgi:hypothetical protein
VRITVAVVASATPKPISIACEPAPTLFLLVLYDGACVREGVWGVEAGFARAAAAGEGDKRHAVPASINILVNFIWVVPLNEPQPERSGCVCVCQRHLLPFSKASTSAFVAGFNILLVLTPAPAFLSSTGLTDRLAGTDKEAASSVLAAPVFGWSIAFE